MLRHFVIWSAFVLVALQLNASESAPTPLQKQMIASVDTIESVFGSLYAPVHWKREFANWDLKAEANKVRAGVLAGPDISIQQYQVLLRDFFYSTKDYHVSVRFYATEVASLPLSIKSVQGRYFIAYIDRSKLSRESFPFEVGTEVVSFGGKPIQTAIDEVKTQIDHNVAQTDQSLAENALTLRRAARGVKVPKGTVTLGLKTAGPERVLERQLVWDYTPEFVDNRTAGTRLNREDKNNEMPALSARLGQTQMSSPVAEALARDQKAHMAANPFNMGAKKSFLPALGRKIWEADASNPFDAYIFKHESGKLVGYVRISAYSVDDYDKYTEAMEKILTHFQAVTDGLVIDQFNNPGGSVFYLYNLASMLTDQALHTPQHHMSLTQAEVIAAYQTLEELEDVKTEEQAQQKLGKSAHGFPVTMQYVAFLKDYAQFVMDEWKAGRTLTNPYFIEGADQLNPHPRVQYTRPIMILVNELDFSGGDFFPAIMQDNKRVTVFGTRTAGAGGYVLRHSLPNLLGVESFSVTGSLAKRVNDNPIENLGVVPDVEYSLSVEDFQSNFKPLTTQINKTLVELLK